MNILWILKSIWIECKLLKEWTDISRFIFGNFTFMFILYVMLSNATNLPLNIIRKATIDQDIY